MRLKCSVLSLSRFLLAAHRDSVPKKGQSSMVPHRKPLRQLSERWRGGGLTTGERLRCRKLLLWAGVLLCSDVVACREAEAATEVQYNITDQNGDVRAAVAAAVAVLALRQQIMKQQGMRIARVRRVRITIDSFTDDEAWRDFRVRKCDFPRLLAVLQLPGRIGIGNGGQYDREEALLVYLRRMSYAGRLADLKKVFGREETQICRLCNTVTAFIIGHHRHLLRDTLRCWVNDFPNFARAIRAAVAVPDAQENVVGFVDGTLRPNCRPGGHDDLQRQLYSGHKRTHGLKWQGLMLPNGIIADLYGPYPGRRHDSFLLGDSMLNDRLQLWQQNEPVQYKVYGDSAYPVQSHISRGHKGVALTEAQQRENRDMSAARICVEWGFGKVSLASASDAAELCTFRIAHRCPLYACDYCIIGDSRICAHGL